MMTLNWLTKQTEDTGIGLMLFGLFIALTGPLLKLVQVASMGVI